MPPTTCGQLQSHGNPGPQGAAVASLSHCSSIAIILTQPQTGIFSVSPRSDVQKEERKHRTGSAWHIIGSPRVRERLVRPGAQPPKEKASRDTVIPYKQDAFPGVVIVFWRQFSMSRHLPSAGDNLSLRYALHPFQDYSYKFVHSTVFYNYLLTIWPRPGNVPVFTPTTS